MNNKIALTVGLRLETTIEEKRKIISLINKHVFFLGLVFIVYEEEGYRLVEAKRGTGAKHCVLRALRGVFLFLYIF